MCANPHIVSFRQSHRMRHHCGIGGVKAAGHVGDRDMGHHAFIVANFVKAEALAHVAVDCEPRISFRRSHHLHLFASAVSLPPDLSGVLEFNLNEGHDPGSGVDDVVLNAGIAEV